MVNSVNILFFHSNNTHILVNEYDFFVSIYCKFHSCFFNFYLNFKANQRYYNSLVNDQNLMITVSLANILIMNV